MAINLVRNSKVFFTTNIDSSGVIKASGGTGGVAFSADNTYEIQVLDGFTFSQSTANEVVTLSEAGTTPSRGQRAFNTSLAPVSFSFSTYIKPALEGTPNKVTSGDSLLWNALMSDTAIVAATAITGDTAVSIDATGLVTIAGTVGGSPAMTPLPTVGDYIVLSGVASASVAGHDKYYNSAGKVITSTVASITVQLINHAATVSTATLTTAGIAYSKCAWNESNLTYSQITSGLSDRNQLQTFGMLFLVDNVMYAVDNASLGQVTIDFGLDAIATAQWTGQATALRQFGTGLTASAGTFGNGGATNTGSGAYLVAGTTGKYITNKISTITLKAVKAIGNSITTAKEYLVPITGGSFTINNNINYITPAILGAVNTPVTYYTGTRAISGSVMAYLRTGSAVVESGALLSDLLAEATTTTEPMFSLSMNIGGVTSTNPRVIIDMPSISLGIPTIDVQQVVSTTINFTAQGYTPNATPANSVFDLTKASDLAVRYYGVA
jgi:hypothetical protein